ncbi:RagB/SusD family nutrient uptake outer membrane protein [Pedobacter caeni]|uniref:SusD family protein n=1 Tax=Pedobacter caeni TaxID=288992 RepID=A0A1M5PNQ0_9SPHI|nr:RagB/SusD family nutrient uptake outer membrane protein [Pedobacter caeni]SHH03338.1 SusD family protein [Pedobacter caeni]
MSSRKIYIILFTGLLILASGCKKFLEAKPDKKLAVPVTIKDFQSLMDNAAIFLPEPHEGEFSSDDHYLTNEHWESLYSEEERRIHIWEKDFLFQPNVNNWDNAYKVIYYCNSVLEGLNKVDRNQNNAKEWDYVKGQALYFRGKRLLQASLIWTPAYGSNTADLDLGLPLRLNTNFNEKSRRASVRETYQQMIIDIKSAANLLSATVTTKIRPSKPAAYALLSRIYLSMGDYVNSGIYADSCLQIRNELIDYNDLDAKQPSPLKRFNAEVISENGIAEGQTLNLTRGRVNPDLYKMYQPDDLRKEILFTNNSDGSHGFKGRFAEGLSLFGGMATNEVYLNRAESNARMGKMDQALDDINFLLKKRWLKDKFIPFSGLSSSEVLELILNERRKELLFRGIRWMDLKRLNKEGRNISLTRNLKHRNYVLAPNDLKYTLPIPEDVIIQSGMQQNPR